MKIVSFTVQNTRLVKKVYSIRVGFKKLFNYLKKKTTWIHLYVCMLFFNIVAIHSDLDGEAEDKFLDTTSKKTPVSSLSHSHFHLPLHFFVRQKPFSTHVYQEVNRW